MARALLDVPYAASFLVDPAGTILDANETLARRFDTSRAALVGTSLWDLFTPEVSQLRKSYLDRAVAEKRAVRFEDQREGLWNDFIVSPILDAAGNVSKIAIVAVDVTERKQAEARLRESEEQYRQLVETANSIILRWDTAGTILFINTYGARHFGFDENELIGRNVVGSIVPEREASGRDLAQLMQEIQRAPDRFVDNENENITKDGRRVWVRWANKSLSDRQGRLVGILSVGTDITERKRTEEALAKSERWLQTIIESEPACVKILDENANLILMNRAGLQMLEVESLDEVKGTCICPLVTSAYRPAFMDLTRRVFRGETGTLLFEMTGVKGRHLWLETHAVPLRDERNEIVALLGVTRDVTERKKAEERIRQSEEFTRSILDTVDEGFLVVDREYRILTANKAYCAQVSRAIDDIVGHRCFEISHGSASPCHLASETCPVQMAFATDRPQTVVHRHRSQDNRLMHVETRAFPLRDAAGTVTSVIETITDITERHLLEEERLKTQKLESIGVLAGGIAHDFNNLLQGVFGYISLARLTLDQPERSLTMLEQAEKALHQAVDLTTQLLTFSKGGKPLMKPTALGPVVENAARFALSGSRSECVLDIDPGLWRAEVDAGQIGQVVQNIVMNADQATPLGGKIEITATNVPAGSVELPQGLASRDQVSIQVRDAGTGIPEQHLTKIFDPYFTTKEKGSGLGLATSYSIVKNHGGAIVVASALDRGSVFTVYLPAVTEAPAPPPAPAAAPAPHRGARVLVMDDEDAVRMVCREMLAALGHEVLLAAHGDEAVERYLKAREEGRPIDVVILDLTIRGGMGGAETVARLREIDPGVKAIVSSGYGDDQVLADHQAHGFSGCLKKPYHIDDLKSAIAAVRLHS